jgi:hypothetical protein
MDGRIVTERRVVGGGVAGGRCASVSETCLVQVLIEVPFESLWLDWKVVGASLLRRLVDVSYAGSIGISFFLCV